MTIISNEEIDDIKKILKFLEKSGLLIKDVNKTMKKEEKNKKGDFLALY